MTGGFNPEIEPERTINFESGIRGSLHENLLQYDVAVYLMSVRDRILPYRTEQGGDRDFFRNQGRSLHRGIELFLGARPYRGMFLSGSYSFSRNTFRSDDEQLEGVSLKGNSVPGLPDHRLSLRIESTIAGFYPSVQLERVSSFHVNSLNTVINEPYTVADARISYNGFGGSGYRFIPFVRVNNLADARYNSSVIINAANNRFFEPAAGRSIQAGFNVVWGKE
jgi:iron complex outermembrane recepter protein